MEKDLTEKQKFWQMHIQKQEQSGRSRRQYCEDNGLNIEHMGYYVPYLKKLSRKENRPLDFVKIKTEPRQKVILFKLGSDVVIECPVDSSAIKELVKSLL